MQRPKDQCWMRVTPRPIGLAVSFRAFIMGSSEEWSVAKLLAFAGSKRKESVNVKLLNVAVRGARDAGASVTTIDLADYSLPIFDEDEEAAQGMPEAARQIKRMMVEHDGFLIASPEYNSAFSPLLKNVVDWASRAESKDEPPLAAYQGKLAVIMSASPGALGGIRGLVFLRMLLGNIGVTVLPNQKALPRALKAFHKDGSLLDKRTQDSVLELGRKLASAVDKMHG